MNTTNRAPEAGRPRAPHDLPHALTFFMTATERAAVLAALRERGGDRVQALLDALGIAPPSAPPPRADPPP